MTENNLITTEEWRPVVGYEGVYSVSNYGRVRRELTVPGVSAGRIMSPHAGRAGYLMVGLSHYPLPRRMTLVHRLVAAAFLGDCPVDHVVNHKNGIKGDNRAVNLEYVTRSENNQHAVRLGLFPCGNRNGMNTHPEKRPKGDSHYSRTNPEKLARGERHASKLHPEIVKRGASHYKARLTEAQVLEIRAIYAAGLKDQYELAKAYGVGQAHISNIVRRKVWSHI